MKEFDLIIIGGGASGLMAAYAAKSNSDKKVLLIEKNNMLGRKLYITGKGRCNVTNSIDISDFLLNVTRNPNFLYSSFYRFSNEDTMNFFEMNNVPLKIERGRRVFPESDKSSDIIKAFTKSIEGIQINLKEEVLKVLKEIDYFLIKTNKGLYKSESIIIATGGLSYPSTGSTGDGYKFAKKLGHNIIQPLPSLCPILLNDKDVNLVTGLTVKNAELSLYIDEKLVNIFFGDFLFTHKGISGPLVLTVSDLIAGLDASRVRLICNFKPSIPIKELEERILKDIDSNPKRELKTLFSHYFPKSLGEYLLSKIGLNTNLKLHEINKEIRKDIVELMTEFEFDVKGLDNIKQAIITKGGVSVDEINPSTMESKLVNNLYFCGEVIDVSALTGGFNLQIAFSTGYLAGFSASSN